ncbi:resistance protein, partial [Trifolium pratense]
MEAMVGETFFLLSTFVKVLLDKLVSTEFVGIFRSSNLDVSLLEKLTIALLKFQAILDDEEEKQITTDLKLDARRRIVLFEIHNLFDEI